MSQDFRLDQDPRKIFIAFLINQLNYITALLFSYSPINQRKAIRPMIGLICGLDEKSKKSLETELNDLKTQDSQGEGDPKKEFDIYISLTNYLHRTYLKEVSWVKPFNPNPKHIGVEQTEQQ